MHVTSLSLLHYRVSAIKLQIRAFDMSKEATVYVVDVSPSMQRLADGKSNFQRANELLLKMLHPKVLGLECASPLKLTRDFDRL